MIQKSIAASDKSPAQENKIKKSIYPPDMKPRSDFYNWLWGKHYRNLYTKEIVVTPITFNSFAGGVKVVEQANNFHGLALEDRNENLYLLKPLGGSTSFLESDFFQDMYNKKDFENTYLDTFIGDAYTIINPYTFLASDLMAKSAGLSSNNPRIYFIPKYTTNDTIADGSQIQDKLVSIVDLPAVNAKENILTTRELLDSLKKDKSFFVNQQLFIRERLFDMLTGDWNKMPENWNWTAEQYNDSIAYNPLVIDRNHAFTRVDGFVFKQMLNVLSLGFIYNYDVQYKNLKKFNSLGYTLDMALAAQSDETVWVNEAKFLKENITDSLIEKAFSELPENIQGEDIDQIKSILKQRRDLLEDIAMEYYTILQKTPIATGTNRSEYFIIDRSNPDSLHLKIIDKERGTTAFEKKYRNNISKEIWIYGLDGDDHFEVKGNNGKPMNVLLITGKGNNSFDLQSKKKLKIYSYPSHDLGLDTLSGVKTIISDNEKVVGYDYTRTKYSTFSFSPWGFYDSDLGFNIGSFVTYTMYGYKRLPFTYQHRLGFNYLSGFMYRGIFPFYDETKDLTVDVEFGFPKNYFNFFGFGNNTPGYKEERNNFNRVNLRNLSITPAYNISIRKDQKLSFYTSLEMMKVMHPHDNFINLIYPANHRVFNMNYFADIGVKFEITKTFPSFLSKLEGTAAGGWKMNLQNVKRNFPYADASISLDFDITDRFSFATKAKGKMLFSDKYEFYQAATTELRGFRENRFLGRYSFYQYSDVRVDMGQLKNPFTPLLYGLFVGIDYGRVWLPQETSNKWHSSYGGGIWLTLVNKITTKYSLFGSKDSVRFLFELGLGF